MSSSDLSIVAQLIEAACRARKGDLEATRAYMAHATRLLEGIPTSAPSTTDSPSMTERSVQFGGLPEWRSRRVIAHVDGNLSRAIRVHELARLVGLSESHFCRAFKFTFGTPPRAYVLRRRIEVAQGLMLTTREPLSSIALKCGMCDQAHFTRSFRRIVGETPRSWRCARRGMMRVD